MADTFWIITKVQNAGCHATFCIPLIRVVMQKHLKSSCFLDWKILLVIIWYLSKASKTKTAFKAFKIVPPSIASASCYHWFLAPHDPMFSKWTEDILIFFKDFGNDCLYYVSWSSFLRYILRLFHIYPQKTKSRLRTSQAFRLRQYWHLLSKRDKLDN